MHIQGRPCLGSTLAAKRAVYSGHLLMGEHGRHTVISERHKRHGLLTDSMPQTRVRSLLEQQHLACFVLRASDQSSLGIWLRCNTCCASAMLNTFPTCFAEPRSLLMVALCNTDIMGGQVRGIVKQVKTTPLVHSPESMTRTVQGCEFIDTEIWHCWKAKPCAIWTLPVESYT